MPGRSTTDEVFGLIQNLFERRNRDETVSTNFLDLRKAFDNKSLTTILGKLNRIGCDENALSWFRSYLNRSQCTTVANTVSASKVIEYVGFHRDLFYVIK